MFIRIFIIFIIFLVSACNDDSSEPLPTTQLSISTTKTTKIQPDNSTGLKGTDANNNGIRDDIEQLIVQKFAKTPEIKRAAEQEARALQRFMEAQTKEEALKFAEQIGRATSCTFKILSHPVHDYKTRQALSKEIEAWTTNTKERLSKYLESSKLISGAYISHPVEPVCDLNSYVSANNCELEEFRVVFENGELTTPLQAFTAKNELALNLGNSYANQAISYDLAYNYSSVAYEKLLQSANPRHWYVELARLVYNWKYQINASEINEHVEKYREAILQGQKVLVVSHSQGNFYTNLARQMLANQKPAIPMSSFGIFAVATPANNVGTKETPYLTNHLDIISIVPSSLAANWTLRSSANGKIIDNLGSIPAHNFTETYLSPHYDIGAKLIKVIKQELQKLQTPPQIVKTGSITVTLTWNLDKTNDVDLHIFEPNQTHVYYGSKTGNSGYLDVDNVNGFGPEHYYTDCNKLQVGEYLVGVNYYNDSANPTREVTATVTISIPGSTRTFITKLDYINRANSKIRKLAKIVVKRNKAGRLKYQIIF
jgi:hypothetical protein